MPLLTQVAFHPSQFPDRVQADLLESLRRHEVNPKFLYDGLKQTQKWLALHEAWSPARKDPGVGAAYERAFRAVSDRLTSSRVQVIGLGCGGGQKDVRLLELLAATGREVFYRPVDVSAAMVLTAQKLALRLLPASHCEPVVCDLAGVDDLSEVCGEPLVPGCIRIITFFGMLPNFEPDLILPRLAALVRQPHQLLVSANLAPGPDFLEGMNRILPQYDNAQTRDWLMAYLLDLGFETQDGGLEFRVERQSTEPSLMRVVARFQLERERQLQVHHQTLTFSPGESLRVFFSYRHTPALVRSLFARCGLFVGAEWLADSGEEGVFAVARRA